MILTGKEIINQYEKGNLFISNFSKEKVNPNSYNLTLSDEVIIYENEIIDVKKEPKTKKFKIDKEKGFMLLPNKLYLCRTNEHTSTEEFVPMLEGRSSLGRLGVSVHVTAGFGDIGFSGTWTLEVTVTQPTIIYPNMEICQIYYLVANGNKEIKYNGKYKEQLEVEKSLICKEFKSMQ